MKSIDRWIIRIERHGFDGVTISVFFALYLSGFRSFSIKGFRVFSVFSCFIIFLNSKNSVPYKGQSIDWLISVRGVAIPEIMSKNSIIPELQFRN